MWRLGSTSYIYPGDFMHNLRHLAGTIEDMELVLFHTAAGVHNYPSVQDIDAMASFAQAHDITFTVHLPFDLDGQAPLSLDHAIRIITLTQPLKPWAFVFHLTAHAAGTPQWLANAHRSLDALCAQVTHPALLALENLERYDPELLLPFFDAYGLSRTLDIGHLWKMGRDDQPTLTDWLPHTRVIHLHGMTDTDHQSLAVIAPDTLDAILHRLADWHGVLTMEVFEYADFTSSLTALRAAQARLKERP